jgi:hypothetical protein
MLARKIGEEGFGFVAAEGEKAALRRKVFVE